MGHAGKLFEVVGHDDCRLDVRGGESCGQQSLALRPPFVQARVQLVRFRHYGEHHRFSLPAIDIGRTPTFRRSTASGSYCAPERP